MSVPCVALLAAGVDPLWLTPAAEVEAAQGGQWYTPEGRTEARWYPSDVAACEAACASCPVLVACRARCLDVDVAGYCGGLPASARQGARHDRTVVDVSLTDPNALPLIRERLAEEAPSSALPVARVSGLLRRLVRAWADEGLTHADMLERLGGAVLYDGRPVTRSTLYEASRTGGVLWEQEAIAL